jgi:predicted house-cleaning noncanonical NTP pyrophosphatase (MazG superfamily)
MGRRTPFISVSAVVSPSISEEIGRLAATHKVTKSTMVRKLLEEKLTERANERQEETYDKLERRLQRIEERFSGLIVKAIRIAGQSLYLNAFYYREFTNMSKEDLDKLQEDAKAFAGNLLKQQLEKPGD